MKSVLLIVLTLISLLSFSQTEKEYKTMKITVFTKALINSKSCDETKLPLAENYFVKKWGALFHFRHKIDKEDSFVFYIIVPNEMCSYKWATKEKSLVDFKESNKHEIEKLGYHESFWEKGELNYILNEENLRLKISINEYTGKLSCILIKYPEGAFNKRSHRKIFNQQK